MWTHLPMVVAAMLLVLSIAITQLWTPSVSTLIQFSSVAPMAASKLTNALVQAVQPFHVQLLNKNGVTSECTMAMFTKAQAQYITWTLTLQWLQVGFAT
jgi:hypothetical protein